MANIYVRSTDGNDADDGTTWALAKDTMAGAAAIDAAGDTIYVSQDHTGDVTGANLTLNFAGTNANPIKIICANDAAEPPTSVATTGVVQLSAGSYTLDILGGVYVYGMTFRSGENTLANNVIRLNSYGTSPDRFQEYKECVFDVNATGGSANLVIGGSAANAIAPTVTWHDCDARLAGTGSGNIIIVTGNFNWNGGALLTGGTNTNPLFSNGSNTARSSVIKVSGVDFSAMNATRPFFNAAGEIRYGELRNCKLPTSWSGGLTSGTFISYPRFAMYNCDSSDTNYKLWIETYAGSIKDETTIVRTGGASDGTTTLAWKLASSANANEYVAPLETDEIVIWNETTGSSITASVEIVHDSQGAGTGSDFTNAQIWMEVQYLGTSGVPLGTFLTNKRADVLATAADHANSSETWTTTGLTTPVKQTLSVSFTPQEKGFIHAKIYLAAASKTVYVDPLISVA